MSASLCSQCGGPLAGTSGGVCPKCLLKLGLSENDQESLKPGTLFHGLEIERKLGAGGMGVVYKARQPNLDRSVAVKVLPKALSDDPEFTLRFMREARALASLNHPNIVAVYDFGVEGGRYFFVMEFVDGTSLRPVLDRKAMTAPEALKIVPMLCEALEYAHTEGVVHRDIKPENILLDKKGRVKIADFGLAKLLDRGGPGGQTKMTQTNVVMGTPHYMAPEQYENAKSVDHRADIYSIGVLFYEMLTGELPIGRFPPPSERVHVDVRIDEIVLRALEKEPEKRYQTMADVGRDVTRVSKPPSKRAAAKDDAGGFHLWEMVAVAAIFGLVMIVYQIWPTRRDLPDTQRPDAPTATSAPDLSAAALAKAENLLKQDQPSLAFEALDKRIHEDPENLKLRELAVTAAGKQLDSIVQLQGREEALKWLAPLLREKSYLKPLAVRYAVIDTEHALQTMFDTGRAHAQDLRDKCRELLAQYPNSPDVPYAAAGILEKRNIPESVLWLYREAFKRGRPAGDPHAFEICVNALRGNRPDDDDGKYVLEFARDFYAKERVAWAEKQLETGYGFGFACAFAILEETKSPLAADPFTRALVNAVLGKELPAASKELLAADKLHRARAAKVLEASLKESSVPDGSKEDVLKLAETLAQ
ncbi:MAG: serine/threonine protein kinase [Planctomycetes bacterium]|nr:serine/threonine protein kinase [Planctomycetota bacterium]